MRPLKLKLAQVLEAVRQTNGMIYVAADRLGVQPITVYRFAKRHPQVRAAIEDARGRLLDEGESALRSAVLKGEGWAVCFLLKTLGKQRGYVERHEIDVDDSRPRLIAVGSGNTIAAFAPRSVEGGDESREGEDDSSGPPLGQNRIGSSNGSQ